MAGGRPPKYTPERLKAILKSISNRIPYQLAAEANGICEDTLYDWLNTGKRDLAQGNDTILAQFTESLKKIEQKRMETHLRKLKKNVKNWQADAWILERRWPKHFGTNAVLREQEERLKILEEKLKHKDNGND